MIQGEFLSAVWLRLKAIIHRQRLDRNIEEELQFHLAMREQHYQAEGTGPADAHRAARRQFGNAASIQEECRETWTFHWIEAVWQDARYGLRQLRRTPGFTAVAAITLALGIGGTTAVFSVCDALLWKTIELPDMNRLVVVLQAVPDNPHLWSPASPADIEDIHRDSDAIEHLASWAYGSANLVDAAGEPVRIDQARVTPNLFDVLGVQPAIGRVFLPGEDMPGREREVILSDQLWRARFGADPKIVGREIRLNDQNYTVIGVMPAKFAFPRVSRELWTPLALTSEERHSRNAPLIESVGRLRPGQTLERLAPELKALGTRLESLYPSTNTRRSFLAWPIKRYLVGDYASLFGRLLLGATLFVLLIACVNVANLQLARAAGRAREVAVRTALGASRRRIVLQLVIESLVLAVAAAILGVLVAKWGLSALRAGMPAELQRYSAGWSDMGINARALAFALGAAVLSGILTAMAPAWRCSRPNLTESLKEGGRSSSGKRGRHRLRMVLIATELSLAVVLLVGAGLMIRGFNALLGGRTTLDPASMLTLRLEISEDKYPQDHQAVEFYRDVLQRTGALPGVDSVAAATAMPYSGRAVSAVFTIEGRQAGAAEVPQAQLQSVSAGYFKAMRIPLRAGRLLAEGDGAGAGLAAVISERLAQKWWPGEGFPIGRHFRLGAPSEKDVAKRPWITIVGIVGDVETSVLDRAPRPTLYVPYLQHPRRAMGIGIRVAGDPMRLAASVRAAIRAVDAEQPATNMLTLERLKHDEAIALTYSAALMGILGAVAMVLSLTGVYGLTAYLVSEQTHEIGIRVALGASRGSVLGMVFRRGMLPAIAGLALGILLASVLARVMAAVIWGVNPGDATAFIGMPLALSLAVATATYIAARRALKIEPIIALRAE